MLEPGLVLLQGRYRLQRLLRRTEDHELWIALDQEIDEVLVKAWPYQATKQGNRPPAAERALWDIELRHLFRFTSSPEAESHLVTLRNAGIDLHNSCFLLVLTAPGLTPLHTLLQNRLQVEWLRDIRRPDIRKDAWRAIRHLASGLALIHAQQMIHGAISTYSVFIHAQGGPQSMRLGGFEWAIRVASPAAQPSDLSQLQLLPPELDDLSALYSFESDWYCFGALVAQILTPTTSDPNVRMSHSAVIEAINKSDILDLEKNLLVRLLDPNPSTRLAIATDILKSIDLVLSRLEQPKKVDPQSYLALAVSLGPGRPVTIALCEEDESINALDEGAQRQFIENDLSDPYVVRLPAGGFVLLGTSFQYWISEFALAGEEPSGDWNLAFCNNRAELGFGDDCVRVRLDQLPIKVFNSKEAIRRRDQIARRATSWKPFLPQANASRTRRARLDLLHDFFRVTNQVELLFCAAQVFPYIIAESTIVAGFDEIVITEGTRAEPASRFASRSDNLLDFIDRERNSNTNGGKVYLGEDPSLFISDPPDVLFWTVVDTDSVKCTVTLRRPHTFDTVLPPNAGYLRAFGLQGQLKLIRRRKDGIDLLSSHYYLLQSFLFPDSVFIDTGETRLPIAVKSEEIDPAKRDAIKKIWQTRPIFALQGPPGTGKTTLVANLIGQIFEDDDMAQVLITAQAHPAVDVLRRKVRTEVFRKLTDDDQPLAIRVNAKDSATIDDDTPERVTELLIERAIERLPPTPSHALQRRWREWLIDVLGHFKRREFGKGASDLVQLIKRSANITYCTSTAATLAALADVEQSFDWSIIEEAGKAHGFDLALPLQLGHRWLLIGDHYQLRPYRYDDFKRALQELDSVFEQIKGLPGATSPSSLVDWELLRGWQQLTEQEKVSRREFWLEWLTVFGTLYKTCEARVGTSSSAGLSKMLDVQHRMHPTIAGLVSEAFYQGKIRNGEKVERAGVATSSVTHPFVLPAAIQGRSVVWLDVSAATVPSRGNHTSQQEVIAVDNLLRTLKVQENFDQQVSTVVLSPYLRQVRELSKQLSQGFLATPPKWMNPHQQLVHSVDSFQGNQAQLVVVSLVRNNAGTSSGASRPLGFLDEPERVNVMLSRAEQLLVLVGSWEFFTRQVKDTPADASQYAGFWRIAIDYLKICFESGSAVFLSAADLGERKP